jgi:phage gpG-like protein
MAKQNQSKVIAKQLARLIGKERYIMRRVGVIYKNFFLDSFKMESWEGDKWQPRKRQTRSRGRNKKILVDTGELKGSIKYTNITNDSVTIKTDVEYASFHNEGSSRLPQRQFMLEGNETSTDVEKMVEKMLEIELNKIFK